MNTWYVVGGIIVAMVVTFFTRVIPFPLQTHLANSGFLREFSRWMPLGAMVILFAYACSTIPAGRWLPYMVALAVTMALHWWRRNVLLSIVVGTGVCVGLSLLQVGAQGG